jgi:hypothetical protein
LNRIKSLTIQALGMADVFNEENSIQALELPKNNQPKHKDFALSLICSGSGMNRGKRLRRITY